MEVPSTTLRCLTPRPSREGRAGRPPCHHSHTQGNGHAARRSACSNFHVRLHPGDREVMPRIQWLAWPEKDAGELIREELLMRAPRGAMKNEHRIDNIAARFRAGLPSVAPLNAQLRQPLTGGELEVVNRKSASVGAGNAAGSTALQTTRRETGAQTPGRRHDERDAATNPVPLDVIMCVCGLLLNEKLHGSTDATGYRGPVGWTNRQADLAGAGSARPSRLCLCLLRCGMESGLHTWTTSLPFSLRVERRCVRPYPLQKSEWMSTRKVTNGSRRAPTADGVVAVAMGTSWPSPDVSN